MKLAREIIKYYLWICWYIIIMVFLLHVSTDHFFLWLNFIWVLKFACLNFMGSLICRSLILQFFFYNHEKREIKDPRNKVPMRYMFVIIIGCKIKYSFVNNKLVILSLNVRLTCLKQDTSKLSLMTPQNKKYSCYKYIKSGVDYSVMCL